VIVNLLIGLPNARPGGLLLTIIYFLICVVAAVLIGWLYAAVCVLLPKVSLPLQAASSLLRGIPLLLLMFLFTQTSSLPVAFGGAFALVLYSFSYVGEVFRSFLGSYPVHLAQQARVIGMGPIREWMELRIPWTLASALDALGTHWISLLKDTGALVVLGIGELTSVAKVLSETTASYDRWTTVLVLAAGIYLAATLFFIRALRFIRTLGFAQGLT
jgi:ABC-type amino acid transport system permease subunit